VNTAGLIRCPQRGRRLTGTSTRAGGCSAAAWGSLSNRRAIPGWYLELPATIVSVTAHW